MAMAAVHGIVRTGARSRSVSRRGLSGEATDVERDDGGCREGGQGRGERKRRPAHCDGLVHRSDLETQYVGIRNAERPAEAGSESSIGARRGDASKPSNSRHRRRGDRFTDHRPREPSGGVLPAEAEETRLRHAPRAAIGGAVSTERLLADPRWFMVGDILPASMFAGASPFEREGIVISAIYHHRF